MKKLNQIIVFFVLTGFMSQAWALRVSELFVNGTLKNLSDIGFKNPSMAKGQLETMFKDIFPQGEVSAQRLEQMVSDLAKEDAFFKDLEASLKMDVSSVAFKDIEQAYIDSVMISHVKGKNLVCADACTLGATTTAEKVKVIQVTDANLMSVKSRLDKMSATQKMNIVRKGLGGNLPASLGPLEKKQLAYFFLLKKSKSKTQRNFVSGLEKLTMTNGKANILGSKSKLHTIPSTMDNLSDTELSVYNAIIEGAAVKRQANPELSVENAFYQSLEDMISDERLPSDVRSSLKEVKTQMQAKNCLFS